MSDSDCSRGDGLPLLVIFLLDHSSSGKECISDANFSYVYFLLRTDTSSCKRKLFLCNYGCKHKDILSGSVTIKEYVKIQENIADYRCIDFIISPVRWSVGSSFHPHLSRPYRSDDEYDHSG